MNAQSKIETKVGTLYLTASDTGLQGVYNSKQSDVPMGDNKILRQAAKQLTEYFAGKRKDFDLPLDLIGTPFQKKVWAQLLKIPYGKTVSYKDIASGIKKPKAFRAVGNANGKNPVCIIVPCHRVIAADGSLGGYSSGLKMKTTLLALESR